MKRIVLFPVTLILLSLAPSPKLHAAAAAFDEATDSAYAVWQTGDNSADPGHFGFSSWSFLQEGDSSATMGDLTDNGGSTSGTAWSLFAESDFLTGNNWVSAIRSFTFGNADYLNSPQVFLGPNEQFEMTIDFGNPTDFFGLATQISLQNSLGTERFVLKAGYGAEEIQYDLGTGDQNSGVSTNLTTEPLVFRFTPKSGNGFQVSLNGVLRDDLTLGNLVANDISRIEIRNLAAGTPILVTSMSIIAVPEPAAASLLLLGFAIPLLRRTRENV